MASNAFIRRCQYWYSQLLRLYPKQHHARFAEGMKQAFNDLCRERVKSGGGVLSLALWVFVETFVSIVQENLTIATKCFMNRGSTLFLRLVISLIAIALLAVCVRVLPQMISKEAAKTPQTAWQIYLFLVGAYLQAAIFLFGLYQAFKLLSYVDADKTFSEPSVKALRRIKIAAIAIGILMVVGIAWVKILAAGSGEDDSAGPVMIGLIGTFASCVVAAVATVLQTQVKKAIDTQKE